MKDGEKKSSCVFNKHLQYLFNINATSGMYLK